MIPEPEPRAEVLETELAIELLGPLLEQVRSAAQIQEIRVQSRRERLSGTAASERLPVLCRELARGALAGLQIRYQHEGSDWIDTLLLRPGKTVRLVRTRIATGASRSSLDP